MTFYSTEFKNGGEDYIICCLNDKDYIFTIINETKSFYEEDLLSLLSRIPLKAGSIIDVGANIGNHTIFFAKALGRRTLAFEPASRNFQALGETVRRNGLLDTEKVVLFDKALGEKQKISILFMQEANGGMGFIDRDEQSSAVHDPNLEQEMIEVVRLDDVLNPADPVALMKIDVEGYEVNVLQGAKETLKNHRPLLTLECHTQSALNAIDNELWPLDYRPVGSAGRSFNCIFCHASEYEKVARYADIAQLWSIQKSNEAASIQSAVFRERTRSADTQARLHHAQTALEKLQADRAESDRLAEAAQAKLGEAHEAELARLWAAHENQVLLSENTREAAEKLRAERDQALTELQKSETERLNAEALHKSELVRIQTFCREAQAAVDEARAERDAARADGERTAQRAQATVDEARAERDAARADAERTAQRAQAAVDEVRAERDAARAEGERIAQCAQAAVDEVRAERDAARAEGERIAQCAQAAVDEVRAERDAARADSERIAQRAQAAVDEVRAERDAARADGERIAQRARKFESAYAEKRAALAKAWAVAESLRHDRIAAYAALAKKRSRTVRILARLAVRAAQNETARALVLRTVHPTVRKAITSRLFAPVVVIPPPVASLLPSDATSKNGPVATATAPLATPVPVIGAKPRTTKYDVLVACGAYPGGSRDYGGEFIKTRVDAYAKHGLKSLVVEASALTKEAKEDEIDGIDCLRMPEHDFAYQLKSLKNEFNKLIAHSPSPDMLQAVSRQIDASRCLYWFHGFEVRDYRRLYFNYTTEQMEERREMLDSVNARRFSAARACFAQSASKKIFVSHFLRSIAERDVGQRAENGHVIPNFIDGDFYTFQQKPSELVRHILLIRSFHARNYANDIAIEAIRQLASRPGFADLKFTIRGFGTNFQSLTNPLQGLGNVDVREGHLSPAEMRALHATHGIFLAPSRFDTQGVTMGEAMASGLACITNRVAGIPEFADDECAHLVRPDDPQAFAQAIWDLTHDPEQVRSIAAAAASRVRAQCGRIQTIEREMAIISS